MLKRVRLAVFVAFVVIVVDQLTKWWVVSNLQLYESIHPIPALADIFAITYVTNTGAAFGLLREAGTLFMIASFAVVVVILYYLRKLPAERWMVRIALGLLLGGAIGNLIDRLRLGYVVDFVDFSFWANFNVADSAVSIGAVTLLIASWLEGRSQADSEPSESEISAGEQLPG